MSYENDDHYDPDDDRKMSGSGRSMDDAIAVDASMDYDSEIICLDDVDDYGSSSNHNDGSAVEEWACPRCTLLNPLITPRCEACQERRPDSVQVPGSDVTRRPDPTVRERLIPGDSVNAPLNVDDFPSPSTTMFPRTISGGAFIGGLIGGTTAYVRGESVSSGALNGLITGGVSGAIAAELAREAVGIANASSRSTRRDAQEPAHTPVRYARLPSAGLIRTRIRPDGSHSFHIRGEDAELSTMMLRAIMTPNALGVNGGNVDNMSYEQILETFGDGSENRGAEEGTIRALPTSTISDVNNLPEDQRQCSVCLDEFCSNQRVRRLPCLHFFHEGCIDRW
eukprot:CAMPEP_0116061890 /NCGR_PEP_ID=MMETSP0322-20121206/7369_1 /TAXON_ID=163516 /ORGANISM="Leptocylindrus danicus var. apora, Strain B651" /LENGTH=337 /DNA_ID=CAMNT_0003546965 /DNA_START=300 /DNA_END=1310 /DNA_ORIENTATION=+